MTLKKQRLIEKTFFLLLFSLGIFVQSFAQSSNTGKEFYVTFGKIDTITTVKSGTDEFTKSRNVELLLRISTLEDTRVTLSFTENAALNTILDVPAGAVHDYLLTTEQARAAYSASMLQSNRKSIHITATEPISLIAMTSAHASIEATFVFPVESYGTEYYNIGMDPYNYYPDYVDNYNGYILIAKENNTHIVQTNTALLGGDINTTLNAGEVYHCNFPNFNTRGTRIVSDKPIAFFQHSTQSDIADNRPNYMFEQFLPTNMWGSKFILPTVTEPGFGDAIYARVYAKETTNITVKHSDGTSTPYTISGSASARYKDIVISDFYNRNSHAAYIESDKPVSICLYHYYKATGAQPSQPSEAWLPPVEQRVHNVLASPLDFDATYVYLKIHHYLMIIVPTASKNSTTVSINGGPVKPIQDLGSDFTWVADNIGGSGYSFGRYYFGETHFAQGGAPLNIAAMVDNPDGLIALAYGQGSYTGYFYAVGSGYRDLTYGFTVNGEDYIDVDGKSYCYDSDFVFKATEDTLTNITWRLNNVNIATGASGSTPIVQNNLADGYYTLDMIANGKTCTTHFFVGGSSVIWTPANNEGSDKTNWDNPANWTPYLVPTECHNVYIPGNCDYYPQLTSAAACRDIYFIQGAELGHPELLNYKRAFTQLNFDLKQSTQEKSSKKSLILNSSSTADRMLYSAAVSNPLDRERWYMLSSPLKGVVTGDLGFGGFPLTFLMKFGPVNKDNKDYPVGQWTTPYNDLKETLSPTEGFAFYMYGFGNESNDNTGCIELGSYNDLNDLTYLPSVRDKKNYGIKETNGILELPFFADSTNLYAHRTQIYDNASNTSTFHYIYDGVADKKTPFNNILEKKDVVSREDNGGNYRFASENYNTHTGKWEFQTRINHPVNGLEANDEFLVGNPYMSSIDMVEFMKDNSSSVESSFRIWNGEEFISCTVDTESGAVTPTDPSDLRYIAPLQGFFLTYTGTGDVLFNVEHISTVRPAGSASNLRSAAETKEQNILRIKAENEYSASYALIGYKKGANKGFIRGEDVQKLFSFFDYVPEVYSLAGEIPADINFINNSEEITIPLGIKTQETGKIQLTFTGMDNYLNASKIELIDALENRTIDLTGKPSYTYTFNHTEKGIQNGRFSLRIGASMTALPDVNKDDLRVYGDSKGIYVVSSSSDSVQQVLVYDIQGRKVFESSVNSGYYPLQGNLGYSPLVVKVMTKNQTKTVKLNMSNK